jgi:hypothetical protein
MLCFSPLNKYPYSIDENEIKVFGENLKKLETYHGQVISSDTVLNIIGEHKLIEVIKVRDGQTCWEKIDRLGHIAKHHGWNLFTTITNDFFTSLV